jgi:hypothetical protein
MLPVNSKTCNVEGNDACRNRTSFEHEKSRSWRAVGFRDIPNNVMTDVVLPGIMEIDKATWGLDRVSLVHDDSQDLVSAQQYLLEVQSAGFFVGIFGLAVGHVGSNGTTQSTLLSASAKGTIPSYSYSYTAGSASGLYIHHRLGSKLTPVTVKSNGSLILGGFDASRFDPTTTASFRMPYPANTTLVVCLQLITILDTSTEMWPLPTKPGIPHHFRIDSVQPQISLPLDACTLFEKAFNLTWDDALQLYTIDQTTRIRLLQENAKVRFTLNEDCTGEGKPFTMSYAAFDLQLLPPLVNTTTYYFPLKRATDPAHYILGRAFLQEAYLIVDYERSNFSISQACVSGGEEIVVPIYNSTYAPPIAGSTPAAKPPEATSTSAKPSKGAYAGIGVGVGLLVLLAVLALLIWKQKWKFFRDKPSQQSQIHFEKSELDGESKSWTEHKAVVEAMGRETAELETVERSHEAFAPAITGLDVTHEMDGDGVRRSWRLSKNR